MGGVPLGTPYMPPCIGVTHSHDGADVRDPQMWIDYE